MGYFGMVFAAAAAFSLAVAHGAYSTPSNESLHKLLESRTQTITEVGLPVLSRVVVMTAAAVVVILPVFLLLFFISPGWQPVLGSVMIGALLAPALGGGAMLLDRHIQLSFEDGLPTRDWIPRAAQRLRPLLSGYARLCRPLTLNATKATHFIPGRPVTPLAIFALYLAIAFLIGVGSVSAFVSWTAATAPELILQRENLPLAALVGVSTLFAIELLAMVRVRLHSRPWAALALVWAEPALVVILFELAPSPSSDLGAWTLANVVVALTVVGILALLYNIAVSAASFLAYVTLPARRTTPLWRLDDDEWTERIAETPGVVRFVSDDGAWRRVDLPRSDRHPDTLAKALLDVFTGADVPVRSCAVVIDRRDKGISGGAIRRWSDLGGEWRVEIAMSGEFSDATIAKATKVAIDAVPRAWRSARLLDRWRSKSRYAEHVAVCEVEIERLTPVPNPTFGDHSDGGFPVSPFDADRVFGCYIGSTRGKEVAFLTVGGGPGYFFAAMTPADTGAVSDALGKTEVTRLFGTR